MDGKHIAIIILLLLIIFLIITALYRRNSHSVWRCCKCGYRGPRCKHVCSASSGNTYDVPQTQTSGMFDNTVVEDDPETVKTILESAESPTNPNRTFSPDAVESHNKYAQRYKTSKYNTTNRKYQTGENPLVSLFNWVPGGHRPRIPKNYGKGDQVFGDATQEEIQEYLDTMRKPAFTV